MANTQNNLSEINKELYAEFEKRYSQEELAAIQNNPEAFQSFEANFLKFIEEEKVNAEAQNLDGEQIIENVVEQEPAPQEPAPQEPASQEPAPQEPEITEENAIEQADEIADPFFWEGFYRPISQEEAARADEIADKVVNDENWLDYQKTPEYTANNSSVDEKLNDVIALNAARRLSMSSFEITPQNFNTDREQEKSRIELEYYHALYAECIGQEKYDEQKPETQLRKIAEIEKALSEGKSKSQIFKMLHINPTEKQLAVALDAAIATNLAPVRVWASKAKTALHKGGKFMDWVQKIEAKNPLLSLGMNMVAAGNPVYMGYRSILATRAVYNDYQGFQDYATFKQAFKGKALRVGLDRYLAGNPDSKVALSDYKQIVEHKDYESYKQTHKSNYITQEEFEAVKISDKKQAFSRSDYEQIKQYGNITYQDYSAQMGEKAVNQEMFDSVIRYSSIRRVENYAEYVKDAEKAGIQIMGEKEYNRIRVVSAATKKVPFWKMFADKKTRNDLASHTVIFARSLPVVGQGYALMMTAKTMIKKDYWKAVAYKAKNTGKAVKNLWNAKGKDKQAWKDLYTHGGGLIGDVAGAYMIYAGTSHALQGHDSTGHDGTGQTFNLDSHETANIAAAATVSLDSINVNAADTTRLSDIPTFTAPQWGENTQSADTTATTAAVDVKIPYAADYVPTAEVANTLDVNNLSDRQQHDVEMLFKMYPRAASLILEGNDNPGVNDSPDKAVISSAKLASMWEKDTISPEQKALMVEFAANHFDEKGNFVGESAAALNAEAKAWDAKQADCNHKFIGTPQEGDNTIVAPAAGSHNIKTSIPTEATPYLENDENKTAASQKLNYSFDENGNLVHTTGTAAQNQADLDAKVYAELQTKIANGQKVDAAEAGFMAKFAKANETVSAENTQQEGKSDEASKVVMENSKEIKLDDKDDEKSKNDELHNQDDKDSPTKHSIKSDALRGTYKVVEYVGGGTDVEYQTRFPVHANREIVDLLRETQINATTAGNGYINGDNFNDTRLEIEEVAKKITVNQAVIDDLSDRHAKGYELNTAEQRFVSGFQSDLSALGLERDQNTGSWSKTEVMHSGLVAATNEPASTAANTLASTQATAETTEATPTEGTPAEKTEDNKEVTSTEQQGNTPVVVKAKCGEIAYSFVEKEQGYSIAYKAENLQVDQNVYNALRPSTQANANGEYTSADGAIKSSSFSVASTKASIEAKAITVNEVIYDNLHSKENPTNMEKAFMQDHESHIKKFGLTHDEKGDLVKENSQHKSNNVSPKGRVR